MKLLRIIALTAPLAVAALPLSAHAGGESGVYLGVGAGRTNISEQDAGGIEGDDTGFKTTLGYNFGNIPVVDFAVEGAYVNFGKIGDSRVTYEQTAWDAFALLGVNLGPVGIFGKGGMASWEGETSIGSVRTTTSGTDPVWGVGARIQILSVTGRLEYEYYDMDSIDDTYMTSLSLLYTF
ncbi:MAG TPA: cell envelope biogenesis protein OmpA [Gammaproteobacteria bacterium]|nr:cell envelope biogenesis protein OmpA [Gammaproteobacteria bacterium]